VRKTIAFVFCAVVLLAGCDNKSNQAATPAPPKWKGAPYHVELDASAAKPNAAGVTLPILKYTANPDALETRATLVVRFDASGAKRNASASGQPVNDQMVMAPVDVKGTDGALPADYMDATDKELAKLLSAYCLKGKVKVTLALAKSSLGPQPGDAELNAKRLSDWIPVEVTFKNPHPKC